MKILLACLKRGLPVCPCMDQVADPDFQRRGWGGGGGGEDVIRCPIHELACSRRAAGGISKITIILRKAGIP